MSSIAYNISRKMEWMGRRLRYIDVAGEIKEWVVAMSALNCLLKELDIKSCSDNWTPWKRTKEGVKEGLRKQGSQSWEDSLASKTGRVAEMIERRSKTGRVTERIARRNIPCLVKGRPPRVQVDGDDVEMLDPKAAVLKMLEQPQREFWSDNLDGDGDVSAQEEATKDKLKTNMRQGDLSLTDKIKKREIWRKGLLERVKKENVPVDYWGDVKSGNFRDMFPECAPLGVRVAVIKEMGFQEVTEYLYKELMKFYDKG